MKCNILNISVFFLLFLSNLIVFSTVLDSEDDNIQAFNFLRRNKHQSEQEAQEKHQPYDARLNNLVDITITEDDLDPKLDDSSVLINKDIHLRALEIKRQLIVKGHDDFAIISDLPGKQLHVVDNINAQSCNLSQIISAFFKEKIEADKVFIIKDLTCKSDNTHPKEVLQNLESILIERRIKSNKHRIMFKYKNSNECRICYWNDSTQTLGQYQTISYNQKNNQQNLLVREFWKTKKR